jgi:hypothetical protein
MIRYQIGAPASASDGAAVTHNAAVGQPIGARAEAERHIIIAGFYTNVSSPSYEILDVDRDGDIDLEDAAPIIECMDGPDDTDAAGKCSLADADGDGRVDLRDCAEFQRRFTGD